MKGVVLIVDDDDAALFTLAALLEDEGFTVETADGRETALAALQALARIDLVLCDHHLGDDEGLELVPLIREAHPAASVAVCSGSGATARPAGVDAWLIKADAPERLIASVRALVEAAVKRAAGA
ncbi:MAG TPA: response regulator [Polyangiaceae bacterium]|jgi:CheY-like chemotaxis protein|nr:response regulator [Polyangiaceae bacterium]